MYKCTVHGLEQKKEKYFTFNKRDWTSFYEAPTQKFKEAVMERKTTGIIKETAFTGGKIARTMGDFNFSRLADLLLSGMYDDKFNYIDKTCIYEARYNLIDMAYKVLTAAANSECGYASCGGFTARPMEDGNSIELSFSIENGLG